MDLSTYWAFFQEQKTKIGLLTVLSLVFAGGWQFGKTSSPYYGAQPIIFEDTECEISDGTVDGIVDLKNDGVIQREETKKEVTENITKGPQVVKKPVVAGSASTVDSTSGKFVGSVNSNLFHDPSCSSSKRIKEDNQIWFNSIEDAEKSGYSPSKCTRSLLGI